MTTKKPSSLEGNAPEGMDITAAEKSEARKDGAKEAVQENAKEVYNYLTDGKLPGEPDQRTYYGMDDIQPWAGALDLDPDAFAKRVADDSPSGVPEEKVAGLLALERAGQNRTLYVKPLCKRLGVKSPYEVTSAGPAYTNDASPTTVL